MPRALCLMFLESPPCSFRPRTCCNQVSKKELFLKFSLARVSVRSRDLDLFMFSNP